MFDPLHVYSWDIESLNDQARGYNGLDPTRSRVTEIGVATDESINGGGEVFDDRDEARLLRGFVSFVTSLKPGLLSGWNDSGFDLPFIRHRASVLGVDLPITFNAQPGLRPKYDPLPTSATEENPGGIWSAIFAADGGQHVSLDISQAYRRHADETGVKWSLKPVMEAHGLPSFAVPAGFVDVNDFRQRLHDATPEQRRAYALYDSHGARWLTLHLLGLDYVPYSAAARAA